MQVNHLPRLLRLVLIIGPGIAFAVVLYSGSAIAQDTHYHDFADQRPWLGIPHFANVVSNLPFLVVGLLGIWVVARRAIFLDPRERWTYYALFLGVGLTAFGSSYYHWHPDNARLFWDRLPMSLAFMGLFAAILAERVGVDFGIRLLPWLLLAGVASTIFWALADDLRPYYLVQFYPLGAIPLLVFCFPARYTGSFYLFLSLGWYVLAKVCEMRWDQSLFDATGISGHTIKHLLAALGTYCLVQMVWTRQVITPSLSSQKQ